MQKQSISSTDPTFERDTGDYKEAPWNKLENRLMFEVRPEGISHWSNERQSSTCRNFPASLRMVAALRWPLSCAGHLNFTPRRNEQTTSRAADDDLTGLTPITRPCFPHCVRVAVVALTYIYLFRGNKFFLHRNKDHPRLNSATFLQKPLISRQ
jgi:hypothetical protein